MKKNRQLVLDFLADQCNDQKKKNDQAVGCTTKFIAESLRMQRTNVSSILNALYAEGQIMKIKGKPVHYLLDPVKAEKKAMVSASSFDKINGSDGSLKKSIQQAKAAISYPPHGLHNLILGPTGVGKTMFAELMHKYALENGIFQADAPFVSFNCADYANNPQLLLAHLFGCKKGSFTGADRDRIGIVEKANGGILFLDEVHRLPPEGQEMLFYLIDRGMYTPLGDIDNKKHVEVLIICATTEDKDSVLLSAFTRRIPMIITIPSLAERTMKERFGLIGDFFNLESKRINKEIAVTANAIKNLLLYECGGNLGQLKSDIQLGCANAFLRSVPVNKKTITVHSTDFPQNVRHGILAYKKHAEEIEMIIQDTSKISFSVQGAEFLMDDGTSILPNSFYEKIEKRIHELQGRGIGDKEIASIMSFDAEQYFKKYIYRFENKNVNKEELVKIVDQEILAIVEESLDLASKKLKKLFSTKIFYGLCLHLHSSLQRIREGKPIINHNLREIIENHPGEYAVAQNLATAIEKRMNLHIPIDEIGFMAMFFLEDELSSEPPMGRPIVLIAMYGKATASSMTEVVNKLVGETIAFAYDVSLEQSTEIIYEDLRDLLITHNRGAGAILLTDMGSLATLGELLREETGLEVFAKDMATTPVALRCAQKCLTETKADAVFNEIMGLDVWDDHGKISVFRNLRPEKEHIIITLCTTSEGSAVKLKEMIEENVDLNHKNVQVIPMAIEDPKYIAGKINRLLDGKKVLAFVGTFNPKIYDIPFISISEMFTDNAYEKIGNLVNGTMERKETDLSNMIHESEYYQMVFDTLVKEIKSYDFHIFQPMLIRFLDRLKKAFDFEVDRDVMSGLILHLACTVERLIKEESVDEFSNKNRLMLKYVFEMKTIKELLFEIEEAYQIEFTDNEVCYMLNYFIVEHEEPN